MANTSTVYAEIDTDLKENAEGVMSRLGLTPSIVIQALYNQIVLQKGLPFEVRLPSSKPVAMGGMSRSELDRELLAGIESIDTEVGYSPAQVEALFADN